jgi:membrane fusion protein (multidrug efflux system)
MLKRLLIMLGCALVAIAVIGFLKYRAILAGMAMGAKFAPQPTAVTTVQVRRQYWQPLLHAVGSLRAVQGVTVSTDLAGVVSKISFESGAPVKKGDLLVQLDTTEQEAQLRSHEARRDLALSELARKRDLAAKKAISTSELDTGESELRQAEAMVEETRALIARKHLLAPFDGFLGIRQVNLGQYLNPGAPVVPLESLDPIYVEFALPQQHLPTLTVGNPLRIRAEGVPDQLTGKLTAIAPRIDEATRNLKLQGTIANPSHLLRPGMFVSLELLLPEQPAVLSIPATAIAYAPYGDSVFVIAPMKDKDGKEYPGAREQPVKLGKARGDQVEILGGLADGEEIATSGIFKLRQGAAVKVNNSVQPGNNPAPKPKDS